MIQTTDILSLNFWFLKSTQDLIFFRIIFLVISLNPRDDKHCTSPLWQPIPINCPQSDTASDDILSFNSYFAEGMAFL